jgi:hypothetical protein
LYGDKNGGTWVPTLIVVVVAVAGFVYQLRAVPTAKTA